MDIQKTNQQKDASTEHTVAEIILEEGALSLGRKKESLGAPVSKTFLWAPDCLDHNTNLSIYRQNCGTTCK